MKRSGNATITSFFKKAKPLDPPSANKENNGVAGAAPTQPSSTKPAGISSKSWDKAKWVSSLTPEQKDLLDLEINTMGDSWLERLHIELTKPYFLSLKRFLAAEWAAKKTIFPPKDDIYSWSRLCSVDKVRVVVLGQDPYHNFNQAHGLAFSVKPPTQAPPSLVNIYKELESCYPDTFTRPKKTGLLTPWAEQGVLLLNTCLTVEAHKANSHANKGWEQFTEKVLDVVVKSNQKGLVFMAWGSPAFKRVQKINPGPKNLILRSVHPSPLSASRGWFGSRHFIKANEFLKERYGKEIDWTLKDS